MLACLLTWMSTRSVPAINNQVSVSNFFVVVTLPTQQWGMLSMVLSKGTLTSAEKRQIHAWNRENGVAEEDHWRAVDRLGWTREQYAQGKRV